MRADFSNAPASLAADLRQAESVLPPGSSDDPAARSTNLMLAALWISVDRLRVAVQTPATLQDWAGSESATLAKGRALGLEAHPGERMADYRARLTDAASRRGQP